MIGTYYVVNPDSNSSIPYDPLSSVEMTPKHRDRDKFWKPLGVAKLQPKSKRSKAKQNKQKPTAPSEC